MDAFLTEHAAAVRLGAFAGLLLVMSLAEALAPRRRRRLPRARRWPSNAALALLGGALARALAPIGAVAAAHVAAERGWGLWRAVDVHAGLALLLSVVLLDLAVWGQHVVTHRVPALWRLHRVHHADLDLDATSGVRFHPVEIGLSLLWKGAVVLALGASTGAVVLFEVLLNGSALFNHANVRLPRAVDAALRFVIVTPDMHRVHHSVELDESSSNFGFALSVWDRLFRTYRAAPRGGQEGMRLGLAGIQDERRAEGLDWMLASPLRREP